METLTTEQRMDILAASPKLPAGQMAMKLKYPTVTVKELETRFAVHVTAKKMNSLEEARVINDLAGTYKIQSMEAIKRFTVNLEAGTYLDRVAAMERLRNASVWERNMLIGLNNGLFNRGTPITAKHCTGRVAVEPLDAYMGDEIPDRVLESLYIAREAGLTDFHVAYPVIDVKDVVMRQEQQDDPVLLAKLGDRYLEIDMWE